MNAHLTLSCPECHKPLMQVPHDDLVLTLRCAEHGTFIMRPLIFVGTEDEDHSPVELDSPTDDRHGG